MRWLVLLALLAACSSPRPPLPTLVPSLTASATLSPTATPTPTPSPALTPTLGPKARPSATLAPTFTPFPAPTATVTLAPTPTPLPERFSFGRSVQGRDLIAQRIGTGERVLLLVGGVHAGYEANTVRLMEEMIDHYRARPGEVLPGLTLLIVPVLNVDGLAQGQNLRGRWNANGVDLNRNWGCGWSEDAEYFGGQANPGSAPFSEPETQALGALIELVKPRAALFYHAAARGVFAGNCQGNVSTDLARVYGEAVGYPFDATFGDYRVTGSAPAWLDSLGIPAADVELASTDQTELVRQLRGVQAVQAWLSTQGQG
ncbi:MAG: M14 family zinc carboxypeptidase [Anaerolineae bacterium]|nr:M14 family zinc carboxypeptidase [Anaerolineae bacterium]MDW8173361.1 M14 family zinc carboxypeptidase [Anaerolineae bacterium]